MPKVSVVIPVFNAEEYLERCLNSILETDFAGFEIICVNNGSKDKSKKILESYAEKYPKIIQVLDCETWGASAARNLGAKQAKGKYLWFVDSDDYVEKDALKILYEAAEEKSSDIVTLGVKKIRDPVLRIVEGSEKSAEGRRAKPEKVPDRIFKPLNPESDPLWQHKFVFYGFGPYFLFFKTEFWQKNMSFPEGIIHEDIAAMSSCMLYTEKISCVEDVLYFYCQHENTVLHQKCFTPHVFDIFPALEYFYNCFEKAGKTEEYHAEMEYFFVWNLLIDSARDFRKFEQAKKGFKMAHDMLKKYYPEWHKNPYLQKKGLPFRLRCELAYRGY